MSPFRAQRMLVRARELAASGECRDWIDVADLPVLEGYPSRAPFSTTPSHGRIWIACVRGIGKTRMRRSPREEDRGLASIPLQLRR